MEATVKEKGVKVREGEEQDGGGWHSYPRELVIIDELRPMSVDQGAERQTIFPAAISTQHGQQRSNPS